MKIRIIALISIWAVTGVAHANGKCSPPKDDRLNLESWWWQDVNFYNENLPQTAGVSNSFVREHKSPVGVMANYEEITDPSDPNFGRTEIVGCTGTLINNSYVITAGHCVQFKSGLKNNDMEFNFEHIINPITGSKEIAPSLKFNINENTITHEPKMFNYEGSDYRMDYAILKLDKNSDTDKSANKYFGKGTVLAIDLEKGEVISLIQHPHHPTATGSNFFSYPQPKLVESGHMSEVRDVRQRPADPYGLQYTYTDLDMTSGASGGGVLDSSGFLVGINSDGHCDSIPGGSHFPANSATILSKAWHHDKDFRKYVDGWKLDDDVDHMAVRDDGKIYVVKEDSLTGSGRLFRYAGYDDATHKHKWDQIAPLSVDKVYSSKGRILTFNETTKRAYVQREERGEWEYIGDNGSQYVFNSKGWVYKLSENGHRVSLWYGPGSGNAWKTLYRNHNAAPIDKLYGGENEVYFSRYQNFNTNALYKLTAHSFGSWELQITGEFRDFAISPDNRVYGLSSNGETIYEIDHDVLIALWTGSKSDRIYADTARFYRRDTETQEIYRYYIHKGYWKKIMRPTTTFVARYNTWLSIDARTNDLNIYRPSYGGTGIPHINWGNTINDSITADAPNIYQVSLDQIGDEVSLETQFQGTGNYKVYVSQDENPTAYRHDWELDVSAYSTAALTLNPTEEGEQLYIRVEGNEGEFSFTVNSGSDTDTNYPQWNNQTNYTQGDIVEYQGDLYQVIHTNADAGWGPPNDPVLWAVWEKL